MLSRLRVAYWFLVLLDVSMTFVGAGQTVGLAGWPERWEGNYVWQKIMSTYGLAAWMAAALAAAALMFLGAKWAGRHFGEDAEIALLGGLVGMQASAVMSWFVWTGVYVASFGRLW